MSYYDDQEEAWFANDCKGSPSDYDPYDADSWPSEGRRAPRTKPSQKRGPLHCVTCGAEIPSSCVCPKAAKSGQKPLKTAKSGLTVLVNCAKGSV